MVYLQLFLSFMKIGFTSFGGLSMVSVINQEMLSHAWMTQQEIGDIIAIAEMTPGSLGINCATFAGIRTAGVLGGITATLGVMMPSLPLCLIAAIFIAHFRESRFVKDLLSSVRPVCLGLVCATALTLMQSNFLPGWSFCWQAVVIAAASGFLMWKFKLNVPIVISIAAALGLLIVR